MVWMRNVKEIEEKKVFGGKQSGIGRVWIVVDLCILLFLRASSSLR